MFFFFFKKSFKLKNLKSLLDIFGPLLTPEALRVGLLNLSNGPSGSGPPRSPAPSFPSFSSSPGSGGLAQPAKGKGLWLASGYKGAECTSNLMQFKWNCIPKVLNVWIEKPEGRGGML